MNCDSTYIDTTKMFASNSKRNWNLCLAGIVLFLASVIALVMMGAKGKLSPTSSSAGTDETCCSIPPEGKKVSHLVWSLIESDLCFI
jgi:hypothetical protein